MNAPDARCSICGRLLDVTEDPLSGDCGGDCWGCISEIEAHGLGVELEAYRADPVRYVAQAST